MPSEMRLICISIALLIVLWPLHIQAQFNECEYEPKDMSTIEPLVQVLFGDTAAVGVTVSGNSGLLFDVPSQAVNGHIANAVSDGSVYCLFRARFDQSFGGAYLARVDLDGSTAMEWGHTYGVRTGLPLFLAQDVVIRDSVVSILGYFPLYDENGNPPSQNAVILGNIESYAGRVDIDITDGSLLSTAILADSTVFEGPDEFVVSRLSTEHVSYYRQIYLGSGLALVSSRSFDQGSKVSIDTLFINEDNNSDKAGAVRRSGAFTKVATIDDHVYYLDVILDPDGTSYARILRFDETLRLVDSVEIENIDLSAAEFLSLYNSDDTYLRLSMTPRDGSFNDVIVSIYTPDLDHVGLVDLTTILEDGLVLGFQSRHDLWPYDIDDKLIFTASDFNAFGDGTAKRFNWYQLDDNFEPQPIVEDVVSPRDFVLSNQSFVELPNNQVGMIMRSQCKTVVTNRGDFYELWIFDEDDIASYFLPTDVDEVALDHDDQTRLLVYPNPASDRLSVQHYEGGILDVIDVNGILVSSGYVAATGTIDVSDLPAGIYTVRCRSNQRYARFIKVE